MVYGVISIVNLIKRGKLKKQVYFRINVSFKMVAISAAMLLSLAPIQADAATVEMEATTAVKSEYAGVALTGRLAVGYLSGEAHEYVYWPNAGGHTASELIWDIDSTFMVGIGGSIRPRTWLNFNVDLWVNIGDGDGYMADYDWMIPGLDWTDKSVHDNTDVTTAIMFDVNAEITVFSANNFSLTGIAGYRRDNFEWEARGGSYVYSENGYRDTAGTFSPNELGVTYEQILDVPYFGVGMVGDFDRVHLAAKLTGSVFLRGETVDHHHMRDLVASGDFSGESMWAIDIAFGYDITDSLGIKAAYFYEKYETMTGDSTWDYQAYGSSVTYSDNAGTDLELSMFSLTVMYSF